MTSEEELSSNVDFDNYDHYSSESLKLQRFYNIGAGSFHHPYWTNVDFVSDHYSAIQKTPFIHYDLMEITPLPIEDNVAEIVYSSHTIEHVSDEAVLNMLKEAYRILKPNGGIRLSTDNALLEFMAYKNNDIKFFYWMDLHNQPGTWENLYKMPLSKVSIHQIFLHIFASQLCEFNIDDSPLKKYSDREIMEIFSCYTFEEALNYFTKQCKFNPDYPGNHINWWTEDKLISFLQRTGFSEIYRSGYGQSSVSAFKEY